MDAVNGDQGDEAVVTISSKLHFVDLAGSERLKYSPSPLVTCQTVFADALRIMLMIEILVHKENVQKRVFQLMRDLLLWEKSSLSYPLEAVQQDTFPIEIQNLLGFFLIHLVGMQLLI